MKKFSIKSIGGWQGCLMVLLTAAFVGAGLGGCATAQNAEMLKSVEALTQRVDELERNNQRLSRRVETYEDTVQLLDDGLRSLTLARRQNQRAANLPTIRMERPREPYRVNSSSEIAALDAGASGVQFGDDGGDYEEIVVSDDKVREYIGYGSVDDDYEPAPSRSRRARVPKASVVHGDRLPVTKGRSASKSVPTSGDPIDLYKLGLQSYRQGEYRPAIGIFERFLASNPPHDYIDNALYWLGDCHYGLGDFGEAARYFHKIVKEYPDDNKVPDALLKVGLTYRQLGKPESAQEVLYYLIEAFPQSHAARIAREKIEDTKL